MFQRHQAVLYIGNHRSFFDILLTYVLCPDLTGYVAKKEMEPIPLLSIWMRYLHCLFLDRKDIKAGMKTILTAIEKVKSGISIAFSRKAQETKETMNWSFCPSMTEVLKLPQRQAARLFPLLLTIRAEIFEAHFPKIKPCKVVVEYCKPIYPEQLDREDKKHLGAYTQKIILETLKKNRHLTK